MTFPAETLSDRKRFEIPDRRTLTYGGLVLLAFLLGAISISSGITVNRELGAGVVSVYFLISGLIAYRFTPMASRLSVLLVWACVAAALLAGGHSEDLVIWLILGLTVFFGTELLSRSVSALRQAAVTDPLTGLRNRAGLLEECARLVAICRRVGEPVSMVHIDLDGFKQINDREGHARGDEVLRECADFWSDSIRPGDILARTGGDEFLLVLPGSNSDDARRLMGVLKDGSPADWSFGVAELAPGEELQACVDRADAELYSQKEVL